MVSEAAERFLERTPFAAALLDRDSRIAAANGRLEALLGHGPGGLIGVPALDLVHPDDHARVADLYAEVADGRRPRGAHTRVRARRVDGTWIEVDAGGADLFDDPAMQGILVTLWPSGLDDASRIGWFEAVVRQLSDVVLVVDSDCRVTYASPSIEDLTGFPAGHHLGRKVVELADPSQREAFAKWLEGMFAHPGEHAAVTGVVARLRGRDLLLDGRATNLLDDPLVQGVVIVGRDVTRSHELATEARLAERLIAASPIAVVATDSRGTIRSWNPAAEQLLGWPASTALGQRFRDFAGHDAVESLSALYEQASGLLGGETVEVQAVVRRRDGTSFPASVVAAGLTGSDGELDGFLVMATDLSDVTEARRTAARWSSLARQGRELVAIADSDGRSTYIGPGFTTLLGYEPDSLLGRPLRDILHPDDRGRPGGLDDIVAGRASRAQRDYRARHVDGTWRVLDVELIDQRDDPSVAGIVVIGRDITERDAAEQASRQLANAIESSGAAVIVVDADRTIVSWNAGAEALFGWRADEALGRRAEVMGPPAAAAVQSLADGGAPVTFEAVTERRDGTPLTLMVNASALRDPGGMLAAVTFVAFDVTAQRSAEREREARAAQQAVIATVTGRALGGAHVDDVLEEACRLATSTLGLASIEASLHDAPPPDPAPGTVVFPIEGRDAPVGSLTASPGPDRPLAEGDLAFLAALGNVLGTVVDRGRVADEMRRRALHDDLTDLPNRALLVDRLEQAIGRRDRRGERLAVLFVDLDRFKRVNDTLGHAVGDTVLVEAARRLVSSVRAGDTVARVGGDEFVVLCEDVDGDAEAVALAERIVARVAAPIPTGTAEVVLTASVGVVVADETSDAETLVRDADLAMYRAKQLGRARVEVFDEQLRDAVLSRMGIEQGLRQAIVDERLHVVYQPQADLRNGEVVGLEALVRWDHPDFGPVEPSALVGVADEIGLLDRISQFVLDEAVATVARLRAWRPGIAVAVNLGARQLTNRALAGQVAEALRAADVPPEALVIEVTETDVVEEGAGSALGALRAMGVRVSLDDFGTGWSSLHRLTRLPVDEIKVDRSFVAGVGDDPGCDAVVRALASLAAELGLRLIAEGVERLEQRDRLLALGCRFGQGWLYGGPVSAEELELRLRR